MAETEQIDKRVLVRHYPNASEVTVCSKRKWQYRENVATRREEQSEQSLRSAMSRARATVVRRSLAIDASRMLTFTMPGSTVWNDQPLDDAWAMFKKWVRLMQKDGYSFHYVSVPERQGRGAWHFHVAISEYLPIGPAQAHWFKCGGGNLDVKKFHNRKHSTREEGCANYIGKYINKDLVSTSFGRNRYRTSKGIVIDIERLDMPREFFLSVETIRATFEDLTLKVAGTVNLYPRVMTIASWGKGVNDLRTSLSIE